MPYLPLPDSPDEVLVSRVRARDERAFALIDARYRAPLLAFAAARLGARRQEAEDVVQDALERAYRALLLDDREVDLRPWLYRIVANRVVDEHRRRARVVAVEDPDAMPGRADPVADAVAHEEVAALVADVVALPARQRLALVGQAVDGVPHEVLAARMGTTVGATKTLVRRARGSLQDTRGRRAASRSLRAAA